MNSKIREMSKQDINDVICLWNEFTEILGDMDE